MNEFAEGPLVDALMDQFLRHLASLYNFYGVDNWLGVPDYELARRTAEWLMASVLVTKEDAHG